MENLLRLQLNLSSILISAIVLWTFAHHFKAVHQEQKIFIIIARLTLVELILDSIFWLVDGKPYAWGPLVNFGVNFVYFALQIIVCYLWARYCMLHMDQRQHDYARLLLFLVLLFGLALITINCWTGSIYTVDAANVYHRTWGLWGTLLAGSCLAYAVFSLVFTVWRMAQGNQALREDGKYLIFVSSVPIISSVVQLYLYGLNFIWAGMSIALLLVLVEVEMKRYQEMAQKLSQQQVQIMLSQIQPHFLYNALASIQSLCAVDPESAEVAIKDFSLYLRANMDSLSSNKPIPFGKELEHVKNYLKLERLRFEELLQVKYDIQSTDFFVPALTLQPLVENAVKYGVGRKENGGTVCISTSENAANYKITVCDDGVGFDVSALEQLPKQTDGRSHIGLVNVENRIKTMCGGTLTIESEKELGTIVTVQIPK